MRVVITGATGNVGTSLIECLADDARIEEIVGIARRAPKWRPPKTSWVARDVGRDDITDVLRAADALVHLAWVIQPSRKLDYLWWTNVVGSERVFRAAVDAGVRSIVYASSMGAYSPGPKDDPVDESWPTHGLDSSSYSRHKAYVERMLDILEVERPEVRVVRMRPALIFKRESASSQGRYFGGRLVPKSLLRPGTIPLLPDVRNMRFQAMHTSDAADAYLRVLLSDARGAFNIAAEPVLTLRDVARLLEARSVRVPPRLLRWGISATWRLRLHPTEPGWLDLAQRAPIMDFGRARRDLGWQPKYGSSDAVRELLEGVHEGAGAPTPVLSSARARLRELVGKSA